MILHRDLPAYDRVLLLQGPVGPFFSKFARLLSARGTDVYKVNFNLGDDLFYPTRAFHYREPLEQFGEYLERLVAVTGVKAIFCFGEMRPMHQIAIQLAKRLGIEVWAFEEGFIRPGYITLESVTHRVRELHYVIHSKDVPQLDAPAPAGRWTFQRMASQAVAYFAATAFGCLAYPHYCHHKPTTLAEAGRWARSYWRKYLYRAVDVQDERWLAQRHHKNFFLVPLQVHNDFAVTARSEVASVEDFIAKVMESFARHSAPERLLVFKHHPMDRGHKQYGALIRRLARRLGLSGRVLYLHDSNAPALMKACLGVVVINSTIGLQALYHRVPVLMVGRAFYESLATRGWSQLQSFWANGPEPQERVGEDLRVRLIRSTQIPGSFYDTGWMKALMPKSDRTLLHWLADRVEWRHNTIDRLIFHGQSPAQRGAHSRAQGGAHRW